MQKTSTGMIGKTLPVGPERPSQRRAVAVLEDEDERSEGRSNRKQVQKHRLDRDEQRTESREESEERAADDERDHAPEMSGDRVLVVGVEARTAADAHRSSPEAPSPPAAFHVLSSRAKLTWSRGVRRCGRDDLEERRAAVRGLERSGGCRGRQQRQVAQDAVGPVQEGRKALDPLDPAVGPEPLEQVAGRRPALRAVERHAGAEGRARPGASA